MSLITFGLGGTAGEFLLLGFGSGSPPPAGGSYVTLGLGQTVVKHLLLGLSPASAPSAVYPNPSDVRAGVSYGPTGADYTGTLVPGAGGAYTPRRSR